MFVISPVEVCQDSLHHPVSEVVESLPDARELEEEGVDLFAVIFASLGDTEACPQVGKIVANQLVIGVGHNMVVREEHGRLERKINTV